MLKHIVSKSKAKIKRFREGMSVSKDLKKSRQDLLDNLSDFGALVYRRWNLPKIFATKIQSWVPIHSEKVDKALNHWECEDRVEEVSSSDEEDEETEGLNFEDMDEGEDEE